MTHYLGSERVHVLTFLCVVACQLAVRVPVTVERAGVLQHCDAGAESEFVSNVKRCFTFLIACVHFRT